MVTVGLGALSAYVLLKRNRASLENAITAKRTRGPFMTEGFDFKQLRASNIEWRGPDLGAKIDLSRLQTQEGETLAGMVGKQPIMLVGVHQDCGMCKIAGDEISHLHEKLATMNVKYYPVSFASQPQPVEFFKFTETLKVGAPGFLWNADAGMPPKSLVIMTTPTHLLVNYDGTVLHVWPGSNGDLSVRQRMARQIAADTSVAIDTLNALGGQPAAQTSASGAVSKLK